MKRTMTGWVAAGAVTVLTLGVGPAIGQTIIDVDTANVARAPGESIWFDSANVNTPIGVSTITDSGNPLGDGFLPGWAWTRYSFVQFTGGVHVVEIPNTSKVQGNANFATVTAATPYYDNVATTTTTVSRTAWSIETTRDVVINSSAVLTLAGGAVMFHNNSHWIKCSSGAGYLTSGRADGDLYLIACGGQTDYRVNNVIIRDNGTTPVKVIRDGPDHMRLDATNTYTGGTIVNRGRLAAGTFGSLGTGPVTVRGYDVAQAYLLTATTYSNNFNISGIGWTEVAGNLGAIRLENNARVFGTVTLDANARICTYNGPTAYLDGPVTGGFQLEKNGSGTLVLNNNNTYADTQITEGTLQIGSGGTNGTLGAGNVVVMGTLAYNRSDTNTLTAGLYMQGGSGLSVLNGGVIIPSGASLVATTRLTLQNNAMLDISAAEALSALTVLNGAGSVTGVVGFTTGGLLQPGGDGTNTPVNAFGRLAVSGDLTLDALGTAMFDYGSSPVGENDRVDVGGALSLGGNLVLNAMATLDTSTPYRVFNYVGALSGGFTGISVPGTRYGATVDTSVLGQVNVLFNGGPSNLVWAGGSGLWDVGLTYNWNALAEAFLQVDSVRFDDTSSLQSVQLAESVRPGRITVDNTLDYFFGGAGRISGYGDLVKTGAGVLNVSNANNFAGSVVISGGVLRAVNAAALGITNGATYVRGGTLDVNGYNLGAEWVYIQGTGLTNQGALVCNRAAQQNALLFVGLEGDASVGGTYRFDIRGNGTLGSARLAGGTNTLTKVGTNTFVMTQGVQAQCGPIVINDGILSIESSTLINGDYGVTVNPAGTLMVWQLAAPLTRAITVTNGRIYTTSGTGAQNTLTGGITVNGSLTNDCAGGNINLPCSVNGGSLVKTGASTLTLTGTNDFTDTFIAAGTLLIGNYGPTGDLGHGAVSNNGILRVERSDNLTVTNPITGTGSLTTYGPYAIRYNSVALNGMMYLGSDTNGPTTLVVSNGDSVTVGNVYVGEVAAGRNGNIYQYGGLLNVTGTNINNDGNFRLGHYPTEVSTYFLNGGSLFVTNPIGRMSLGIDGTGVLNLDGGHAEVTRLDVNGRSDGTSDGGELWFSNGVLRVGAGGIQAMGTPYTVVFAGGRLGALADYTIGAASTLANESQGFVLDTEGRTVTQTGAMSGTGGLVKDGAGMLVLNGVNTFTGGLIVSNGVVVALGSQTMNRLANASQVTVENGGIFAFGQVNALPTASNAINFTVRSGGMVAFTNVVGAAGEFHAHVGNLDLQGGLVFSSLSANGYNGETCVLQGDVTAGGASASMIRMDSGAVGGMNLIRTNAFTVADVTGSAAADLIVEGELQGSGGILKLGAGTLALNGNNTYTGYTIISNGTVLVNGTTGGAGPVLVYGGTLGGTGTVPVQVQVANDGTVSPGASIGTLTLNNGLILSTQSRLDFELGTASDRIEVGGFVLLNGRLRITAGPGFGVGTYTLVHSSSGPMSGTAPVVESAPAGYDCTVDTTTQPDEVRLVVSLSSLTPFQQWQMDFFGSTSDPKAAPGYDFDGDGSNNESEFGANTNPTNALSVLQVTQEVRNGTDVLLTWTTAGVRTNRVQVATDLKTTNYVDLSGPILLAAPGDVTTNYLDLGAATNAQPRFYRIRVEP